MTDQQFQLYEQIGRMEATLTSLDKKFDEHAVTHQDIEGRLRKVEFFQVKQVGIVAGVSSIITFVGSKVLSLFMK